MDPKKLNEVIESKEFKQLVATRWSVSIVLTLIMFAVYFGFLALVAFNKDFLATKIATGTTLAIPVGIGILLFSWLITGWYVRWANNKYDKDVELLRKKLQ